MEQHVCLQLPIKQVLIQSQKVLLALALPEIPTTTVWEASYALLRLVVNLNKVSMVQS